MKLLDILIENFDSYRDIQTYKEKKGNKYIVSTICGLIW